MFVIFLFRRHFQSFVIIFISLFFITSFEPLQAASVSNTENKNKLQAVYMYNFLKFVRWPDHNSHSRNNVFEICIIGKHPFGLLLDSWKTKKIDNKKIHIQYFVTSENISQCHMAFIGQTDNGSYLNTLKNLEGKGILTVGENKKFAQQGGMIGFVMKRNRVRFNINRTIAQKQGLKIHSKLLELALTIY